MKKTNRLINYLGIVFLAMVLSLVSTLALAQETKEKEKTEKEPAEEEEVQTIAIHSRPLQRVGNTFESTLLIDNQTVLVPMRKTFEFDIQHRFGTVQKGYKDLWGLYAPSNIRIGFSYTPLNKVMVGFGFTKEKLLWDFNLKYAILKENHKTGKGYPVSVTYFGNVAVDTREGNNFINNNARLSYFNQLMVAKKLTRDFSTQASINLSHMNTVEGYMNSAGEVAGKFKNDHVSISLLSRYKISDAMAFIANFDQPLTKHPTNNPNPNISAGMELATPLHAFQFFLGNYQSIVPQYNNFYNQNNYEGGAFVIGFNITRLLDVQEEDLGEMMLKRKKKNK